MGFVEWMRLKESLKDELKCPHPDDEEFCRRWKLYMKGEGEMPVYRGRAALGHYRGPRASFMVSKKEKSKRGRGKKGSKSDWRRDDR